MSQANKPFDLLIRYGLRSRDRQGAGIPLGSKQILTCVMDITDRRDVGRGAWGVG